MKKCFAANYADFRERDLKIRVIRGWGFEFSVKDSGPHFINYFVLSTSMAAAAISAEPRINASSSKSNLGW